MKSLVFSLILIVAETALAAHWKYQDEEHWSPKCKEGKLQSPIALSTDVAEEKEFTSFIFENYNRPYEAIMKNNGHSAEVRLKSVDNDNPEIKGGNLQEIYELDHLHFHWQSEHTVEGIRFPLELHLVHYAKAYNNLTEALKNPDGVAVFAVLFELSPDDDAEFSPLIEILHKLKDQVNSQEHLREIIVKKFLPRNTAGYYRYIGSLTTPECTEGIVWTVFTNTIPISNKQVKIFEEMVSEDKTKLKQNFRSLQALNDRKVYLRQSPIRNGAGNMYFNWQIFSLAFVILIKSSY